VDFDLIERLRIAQDCWITVGPRLAVALDANGEVRLRSPRPEPAKGAPIEIKLAGKTGKAAFGGQNIHWSISGHGASRPPKHGVGCEFFDADKVGPAIILRHWRPGDRFQPSGMASPVKLQDLFVNQKIARERRHELLVATTAAGEVFWVQQLRIAERFKLSEDTIHRLHWRWNPL
jgi:tRNA(Ile)-lysidine synthetase-like protein